MSTLTLPATLDESPVLCQNVLLSSGLGAARSGKLSSSDLCNRIM